MNDMNDMNDNVSVSAASVLPEYYRILTAGASTLGEGQKLRGEQTSTVLSDVGHDYIAKGGQ